MGSISEVQANIVADTYKDLSNINTYYGSAKYYCGSLCKVLCSELGIEYNWVILTNVYGENENSVRSIFLTQNKILNRDDLLFSSGTQIYDFIHIDDTVKALALVMEKGNNNISYVIGSGYPRPLKEFLLDIIDVTGVKGYYQFSKEHANTIDVGYSNYNISNLVKLGFKPEICFRDGIRRVYDSTKKNNAI